MLSDQTGGSTRETHYQRRVKVHPRSGYHFVNSHFFQQRFRSGLGNSARSSTLEPYTVIGAQISNLRARGVSS